MLVRLLYIVGHQVFKGEHPLDVQIPGAGDEVLGVGVLPRQLKADKVAAVVQRLAVHKVIFHALPARGLYRADLPPGLGGHQLPADVGVSRAAAAQAVQLAVCFKRLCGQLVLGKKWLVVVDGDVSLAGIGGDVVQGDGPASRIAPVSGQSALAGGQGQHQGKQQWEEL